MAESSRADWLASRHERLTGLLAGEADGSKAAALSRELRAIESELADLAPARSGGGLGDLERKRAEREAEASRSNSA